MFIFLKKTFKNNTEENWITITDQLLIANFFFYHHLDHNVCNLTNNEKIKIALLGVESGKQVISKVQRFEYYFSIPFISFKHVTFICKLHI